MINPNVFTGSQEQTFKRVLIDEAEDDPRSGTVLEVPAALDLESAFTTWVETGGQVRKYGETVDMKKYDFPGWLIQQAGARYPQEPAQQE